MKHYESLCEHRMMPLLPVMARVDGRAFHSFCRGMERPYDERMHTCMRETAMRLAQDTNARMAYTQSDEITFVWLIETPKGQIWFGGRHSKMVSQIAAQATLHFYRACERHMPEYAKKLPTFDGRVWQTPNLAEATNAFLWREWDAAKNSISAAAKTVYSDKELHGVSSLQKQEMLFQKGINWNDYPSFFKRGTYIQRRIVRRKFTAEEISRLPEHHNARTNPDLMVDRGEWRCVDMPPLAKVVNREEVIFYGEDPIVETEE